LICNSIKLVLPVVLTSILKWLFSYFIQQRSYFPCIIWRLTRSKLKKSFWLVNMSIDVIHFVTVICIILIFSQKYIDGFLYFRRSKHSFQFKFFKWFHKILLYCLNGKLMLFHHGIVVSDCLKYIFVKWVLVVIQLIIYLTKRNIDKLVIWGFYKAWLTFLNDHVLTRQYDMEQNGVSKKCRERDFEKSCWNTIFGIESLWHW
jgi:hypothetical protein